LTVISAVTLAVACLLAQIDQAGAMDAACRISWTQRHLSVTAQGVPLAKVLADVSNRTGVEFSGSVNGCGRIDVEFSGLPLQEGVERLLTGLNYAIVRSKPANGRAGRLMVVILGCNQAVASQYDLQLSRKPESRVALLHGNAIQRVSEINTFAEQENWDALDKLASGGDPSTQTLALELLSRHDSDEAARLGVQAVHSKDQSRQLAGIQVLSGIDRPDAARALGDALSSSDIGVRESAINALMGQTGPEAITALTQALQDHDPAIRMMALSLLAQRGDDGEAALEAALHNSDPAVRKQAAQLLDEAASQ
jgi:hypothetical protein